MAFNFSRRKNLLTKTNVTFIGKILKLRISETFWVSLKKCFSHTHTHAHTHTHTHTHTQREKAILVYFSGPRNSCKRRGRIEVSPD